DGAGSAYVAGSTGSAPGSFPEAVGPDLTFNGGVSDAFIAKVEPSGTALVYAGYLGGSGDDTAYDVEVDASGSAYLTGITTSAETSFPAVVGPDLTYNGGSGGDTFVAKVDPAGTALVYAGYIGGAD